MLDTLKCPFTVPSAELCNPPDRPGLAVTSISLASELLVVMHISTSPTDSGTYADWANGMMLNSGTVYTPHEKVLTDIHPMTCTIIMNTNHPHLLW